MDVAEHIASLRRDGEGLAAAAERAGPDARVPTCPEWVVRDLVRHTGGVHRWAAGIVGDARSDGWDADLEQVAGGWPADDQLTGWLRAGCETLARTLEQADPQLQCWTFLRAPSPLAMWSRRQAHETAIHRIDAELAAGGWFDFPADHAADGVDELLTCFITRRSSRLRSDAPMTLAVRADDAAASWLVRIGPGPAETTRGEGAADCTVAGSASDLYTTLWNRRPPSRLDVTGDPGILETFRSLVRVRWS